MNRSARRAAEVSASKTKQQFCAAIEHHQAGRLAEAERLYRAIISSGLAIAEAHNNLGFLLHQRDDDAGALAEYRKAVAINPTDPGALTNLGNALRDLGNIDEAEACYRRALSIKEDHPEANNNLGMMLSDRGQHSQALACYRKALATNPGFADALNNSAVAVRRAGNANEAIELWKQAILLRPNCVEAHVYLADTLADLGAVEEARQHALIADALDVPPRSAVRFALGIALARCGIRESAVTRLRQCVAGDPLDRYGARLALAALNEGPVPERASDGFIDRLYAICADRWDSAAGPYPYRGAQLVADRVRGGVRGERLDVLDTGCGTGLVGALMRDRSRRLIGVDLSASMLELARSKNIYDELHKGDLVSFMRARQQSCDVVTCAATLIHFGDLSPAFTAAVTALRTGGSFVFTVFPNEGDADFSVAPLDGLGQGGCFVHGRSYIVDTATANGFDVETIESAVHEYKNGLPITGLVIVLRKA
jgi:predicted TPR repeat methyltransferase